MSTTTMRTRAVMLAIVCTSPLRAQDIATLEARVQRLDSLVASRYRTLRQEGIASRTREDLRTIDVGGFRLRSAPEVAEMSRQAAQRAWAQVSRRGGSWLARELPRYTVLVSPMRTDDQVSLELLETDGAPGIRVDARPHVEGVQDGLVRLSDLLLGRALWKTPLTWLTESSEWNDRTVVVVRPSLNQRFPPVLGADVDSASRSWAGRARTLRMVSSRTNRGCALGDASACLLSLGIGPRSITSTTWYAPSDYPWLIAAALLDLSVPGMRERKAQCLVEKREEACAAIVDGARRGLPMPTDVEARASFLAMALDFGGTDALDRLIDGTGTLEERLSATAGRPLLEVARAWQARLPVEQPGVPRTLLGYWALALAFSAALILIGSRRALA